MESKTLYVGVMGYSGQKFNVDHANLMLDLAFDQIVDENPDREIVIVSGYTNLGIPALAYAEAAKRGWKTAGIACSKAQDYEVFPCDEIKIVGSQWGDESPSFINSCEVFVRIGGGGQSCREAAQAKDEGKKVIEYELPALPV